MKIRSAVPENGCLIFFADGKKQKKTKKNKKTSVKHIRYRLIGGCVNKRVREKGRIDFETRPRPTIPDRLKTAFFDLELKTRTYIS